MVKNDIHTPQGCRILKVVLLLEYLKDRLLDPEEKVRAVACRVIGEMSLDHIIDHVDIKLLQEIAARCKDKKVKWCLARVYGYTKRCIVSQLYAK